MMPAAFVLAAVVAAAVPATAATPFARSDAREALDKYCVTCHNDRAKTGGLSLAAVDLGDPGKYSTELEKAVRKLRSGAMPPAGNRRPDHATYEALTSWLERELDNAAAKAPNAGRTEAMH